MNNPIILFDGVCNLCNSSVNFIIKHDKKRLFRFAPLQSETTKNIIADYNIKEEDLDSVILLMNNKIYTKSDAALKILAELKTFFKILIVFKIVPKFLRDKIYDFISGNRYNWFGRKETCMVPTDEIKNLFID